MQDHIQAGEFVALLAEILDPSCAKKERGRGRLIDHLGRARRTALHLWRTRSRSGRSTRDPIAPVRAYWLMPQPQLVASSSSSHEGARAPTARDQRASESASEAANARPCPRSESRRRRWHAKHGLLVRGPATGIRHGARRRRSTGARERATRTHACAPPPPTTGRCPRTPRPAPRPGSPGFHRTLARAALLPRKQTRLTQDRKQTQTLQIHGDRSHCRELEELDFISSK